MTISNPKLDNLIVGMPDNQKKSTAVKPTVSNPKLDNLIVGIPSTTKSNPLDQILADLDANRKTPTVAWANYVKYDGTVEVMDFSLNPQTKKVRVNPIEEIIAMQKLKASKREPQVVWADYGKYDTTTETMSSLKPTIPVAGVSKMMYENIYNDETIKFTDYTQKIEKFLNLFSGVEGLVNELRNNGFIDQDIYRILIGKIELEELIEEINNAPDKTRCRNLLFSSYLQSANLGFKTKEELETKIKVLEIMLSDEEIKRAQTIDETNYIRNQLNEYKEIYNYINQEITYYLENIHPWSNKEDFNEKNEFDNKCLEVFGDTSRSVSPLSKLSNSEKNDILACIVNNQATVLKDTKTGWVSIRTNGKGSIVLLSSGFEADALRYQKWLPFLTEEEKKVFNYIYNTEGSSKAKEYFDKLSKMLDQRWLYDQTLKDEKFAKEHPVLASAASIFITPIEGARTIAVSICAVLSGTEAYRTDTYSSGSEFRKAVSQIIQEKYGDTAAFWYNTGMSMLDSLELLALNTLTAGTMTPLLSAALMGTRAYQSSYESAKDKGLSEGQAVLLATTSAVLESAMENYSVGHLVNLEGKLSIIATNLTSKLSSSISNKVVANIATKAFYILASAVSQGLAEGEEELATEVCNYIADMIIGKENSDFVNSINSYIDRGYSEEDAIMATLKDFGGQIYQAFLGGFASGFCFGSVAGAKTSIEVNYAISQNMYGNLEGSKAEQFAKALEINRAQMMQYEQALEDQKTGKTLTQEQIELLTNGTIEMQALAKIKMNLKTEEGRSNIASLLLTDTELNVIMNEYNSLLDSDPRLHEILEEAKTGHAISIPQDLIEKYTRLRYLEQVIKSGQASSNLEVLFDMLGDNADEIIKGLFKDRDLDINVNSQNNNTTNINRLAELGLVEIIEVSKLENQEKYQGYNYVITPKTDLSRLMEILSQQQFEGKILVQIENANMLNKEIVSKNLDNVKIEIKNENYQTDVNRLAKIGLAEVLTVSELDMNVSKFDKYDVNTNQSYQEYSYVITPKTDLTRLMRILSHQNIEGKILIEVDNIENLNQKILSLASDNIEFRIGSYSSDFNTAFKSSPNASMNATLSHITYSVSELNQIVYALEEIKSGIKPEWNSYEQALYVYNYMQENINYVANPGGSSIRAKQFDGLGSLIYKESTCQGYAHTYKQILNSLGIKCEEVWGSLNNEGQHAYNIVTIDGKSFIVDTTRESLNKNSPGNFEGTGFGVTDIVQYSAKSNVQLFNNINTDVSILTQYLQNIVINQEQHSNYQNNQQEILKKIENFMSIDTSIKDYLASLSPPTDLDSFSSKSNSDGSENYYIIKYIDELNDSLRYMKKEMKNMLTILGLDSCNYIIDNKFAQYELKIAECRYDVDSVKKLYRDVFSDISENLINKVNTNFVGVLLERNETDVLSSCNTINELLHALHAYMLNDENTYEQMPVISEKKYGDETNITLYGHNNNLAQKIFENLSDECDSSFIDILSLENEILIMARDRGHALTIEIKTYEDGKIGIKYFIPKVTNIDIVSNIKGINKITSKVGDYNSGFFATGYFESTAENIANDVSYLIATVPDDFGNSANLSTNTKNVDKNPELMKLIDNMKQDFQFEILMEKFKYLHNNPNIEIPYGFETVEQYEKAFINLLMESGKINDYSGYQVYLLSTNITMLEEMVGNDRFITFCKDNLTNFNSNVSKMIISNLSKMNINKFNELFDNASMQEFINSLSPKELGKLLQNFDQKDILNDQWLNNETIINKIISMDQNEFFTFVKNLGYHSRKITNYIENGGEILYYEKLLDAVIDKFYVSDFIAKNIEYKNIIDYLLVSKYATISSELKQKIEKIEYTKENIENFIMNKAIELSDVELITTKYGVIYKTDERYRYYQLILEVDGKIENITLSNTSSELDIKYTILNSIESSSLNFIDNILNNKFKIKSIEPDVNRNTLYLEDLTPGLNEVNLVLDGVEKTIMINTKNNFRDLYLGNRDIFDGIQNIQVKSVIPIESYNMKVENIDKYYSLSYVIDGKEYTTILKANEIGILNVDEYIANNNLYSISDVKIIEATNSQIKGCIPDIMNYSASSNIFNNDNYGGNQSQVANLLESYIEGNSSSQIDWTKAMTIDSVIDKYFDNLSDEQKVELTKKYASEGCGYMAFANAFATYMGSIENGSQIFKEKIGFDLLVSDGDHVSYNLEALALDMYLFYATKNQSNFKDLMSEKWSLRAPWVDSIIYDYYRSRNINIDYHEEIDSSKDTLLADISCTDDGVFNILTSAQFDLEKLEYGNSNNSYDEALSNATVSGNITSNISGHAMLVTGVDENLNLIVSSWSEKYKYLSDSLIKYDDSRVGVLKVKFSIP